MAESLQFQRSRQTEVINLKQKLQTAVVDLKQERKRIGSSQTDLGNQLETHFGRKTGLGTGLKTGSRGTYLLHQKHEGCYYYGSVRRRILGGDSSLDFSAYSPGALAWQSWDPPILPPHSILTVRLQSYNPVGDWIFCKRLN